MAEADRGTVADLRSYYEREAELGTRTGARQNRRNVRSGFIELLKSEGRNHVVDFGAGPGHDLEAFAAAGIAGVGLDLALGNAVLATGRTVQVVTGSMAAPPFAPHSFDAGWSMSTFMHVAEAEAAQVAEAMAGPLGVNAPLTVGLWGGARRDEIDEAQLEGERRLFSMRPAERNAELLRAAGSIEDHEIWDVGPDGWEYQLFRLRAHT